MTTREKIIVGIMCLTIIYGAYELLGNRGKKQPAPAVKVSSGNDLKSLVAEIGQKLAGNSISKRYEYMIAQADTRWPKDPFLQSVEPLKPNLPPAVEKETPVRTAPAPNFAYTGFMAVGSAKLAIVNGLEYAEGEKLATDDFVVQTILPNRVVITRVDGSETLQLPIQEMDAQ